MQGAHEIGTHWRRRFNKIGLSKAAAAANLGDERLQRDAGSRVRRDRAVGSSLSGTNLARAGDYNQRIILQAIRVNAPITRAELTVISGLTPPAVNNITQRLLADKLVVDAGLVKGARGQPATKFVINPDGCLSIGVNIDRDHITVLAMDLLGRIRFRASKNIDFPLPSAAQRFCETQIRKLLARPNLKDIPIVGVGVALPDDLGRVNLPHQPQGYSAWSKVDAAQLVADACQGFPVFVENDAAAAALGELQFGHGVNRSSFFYILVSIGLGGGLVVDGHYVRGAHGRSGEIGFMPTWSPDGAAQTLQDTVSLSALLKRLNTAGVQALDPDDLRNPSDEGRAVIAEWIEEAADQLCAPLIGITCVVDPEAVLIGGRLADWIVDDLARALNARLDLVGSLPVRAPVLRAAMAADAPAVGAAILPFIDRLLPSRATLMKTGKI